MTLLTNDPMEILKRKAIIFILAVMVIGGTLATVLHSFEPKTHPISLVIPPLSTIIFLSLLIYLINNTSDSLGVRNTKKLFIG